MDQILNIVFGGLNFSAATLAIILFIYTSTKPLIKNNLRRLPWALRYYLITCCYPPAVILALTSIFISCLYFIFGEGINIYVIYTVQALLAFTSMQFRLSFLTTIIERIFATIYLEKYCKYSSDPLSLVLMASISYGCSMLYIIFLLMWIILFTAQHFNYVLAVTALTMHILTLIITKILHSKNEKMYKLLAYRVSLKRRYQIVENLKVINFLYPKILIFSIIAPIGPLASLFYSIATLKPAPFALHHLPYNISFILISLYRLNTIKSRNRIRPVTVMEEKVLAIISPLGNQLPANIPIDHYFENLQRQWENF